MITVQKKEMDEFGFQHFLSQKNRTYALFTILFSIAIWILFRHFYPKPFITADSYFYILSANNNYYAGYWPIGYPKFIKLIASLSHSSYLLITIQFVISQISLFLFFISIRTIFNLGKIASNILYIFTLFNPILIFANNHIMSDILFMDFSLLWITQLLWIIICPKPFMLLSQAILLFIAFIVRYNATYYPIITIIVYLLSNLSVWKKFIGITITLIPIIIFIQFTRIEMEKLAGFRTFSSAAGWKQASNALYMYSHIAEQDTSLVPEEFKELHLITKSYFKHKHTEVDLYHIESEPSLGCFYMNSGESPLMKYIASINKERAKSLEFNDKASFSAFLLQYGNYLILNHPLSFIKFVIFPNIVAYITPFPEIYGVTYQIYDSMDHDIGRLTKRLFKIDSNYKPSQYIFLREKILSPFTMIFSIINLGFIVYLILISFFVPKKRIEFNVITYSLLLLSITCIFNFLFTIITTTSVIRFQFFSIILEFTILVVITSLISKFDKNWSLSNNLSKEAN